jgi:hypothetical protein
MRNTLSKFALPTLLCIALPAIFFILIGHLGFNPTDDGVIYSLSRRLLFGQIPHKDFISIRPVGSGFLHLIELVFSGSALIYVGRLIFLIQCGLICYCFLVFAIKFSKKEIGIFSQLFIGIISFLLTVNSFPLMPWTTYDSLFLICLSLPFIISTKAWQNYIGMIFLGMSVLCKQNFLPVLIVIPICLNRHKSISLWLYLLLPIIIYLEYIYFNGAMAYFIENMATCTNLISYGVINNLSLFLFYAGLALGLGFQLACQNKWDLISKLANYAYILLLFTMPILLLLLLWRSNANRSPFVFYWSFNIGIAIVFAYNKKISNFIILAISILLAWCCSLSIGVNSPIIGSGILFIAAIISMIQFDEINKTIIYGFAFVTLLAIFISINVRKKHIYRDNAQQLKHINSSNYFGLNYITSNTTTIACLNELAYITNKNKNFIVYPDFPFLWAINNQMNYLPADWPQPDEVVTQKQINQLMNQVKLNDTIKNIIVSKYYTYQLADTLFPINKGITHYNIIDSIKTLFIKKQDYKFFELYIKK